MSKKRSRWIIGSGVPRYTPEQRKGLSKYREADGWRNGARVTRR